MNGHIPAAKLKEFQQIANVEIGLGGWLGLKCYWLGGVGGGRGAILYQFYQENT